MCQRTLETKLNDADPSFNGQQGIKVVSNSHGVSIEARGYGDSGSADGHGSPIYLELYRGRLRLLVWADINVEDPTHIIDLAEAQETAPLLRAKLKLRQAGLSRLQEGRVYLDLLRTPNPTTGNNYTLKEVAAALGVEYARCRHLCALWYE